MKTRTLAATAAAMVALSGLAQAATVVDAENEFLDAPLAGASVDASGLTLATLDVSNVVIDDSQGFSLAVYELSFDPDLATVVGIGWNLNIQTTEASMLSDLQMSFMIVDEFGDVVDGVVAQPSELTFPSDQSFFNETSADDGFAMRSGMLPVIDLEALGLAFSSGDRVIVELYTDFPGEAITLGSGSEIYVEVIPAPASLALVGVGGLAMTRRRR